MHETLFLQPQAKRDALNHKDRHDRHDVAVIHNYGGLNRRDLVMTFPASFEDPVPVFNL